MGWLQFALASALFASVRDLYNKKSVHRLGPYRTLNRMAVSMWPFLLTWWLITGHQMPTGDFWIILLCALPFETIGQGLFFRALTEGEASQLLPLTTCTPIFILLGNFFYKEQGLSTLGICGVCLAVAGNWVVLGGGHRTPLEPLRELRRNRGAVMMLAATMSFAVTNICLKAELARTSVSATYFWWYTGFLPITFLLSSRERKNAPVTSETTPGKGGRIAECGAGALMALTTICSAQAMALAPAAYVNSTKRLSVLLTVLYAGLKMRESDLPRRLLAAVIACAGTALMALQ